MKISGKSLILSVAAAAITLASLSTASADVRWRSGGWGHKADTTTTVVVMMARGTAAGVLAPPDLREAFC